MFGTELQKDDTGKVIELDIRSRMDVENLFHKYRFDAIIHAAAQPSHDWATEHIMDDFIINAYGSIVFLEATRHFCPDATVIHVSTDKVYGENMCTPPFISRLKETDTRYTTVEGEQYRFGFTEDLGLDFAGDRSFFGCSKTAADIYAQEYAVRFGMKVGIFRPGCITGRNHAGAEYHGFLAYLAQCIKNGTTYKIFGHNGKQVRDQIHADDLVSAFFEFIKTPKVGAVYNMGGGPERSVSVLEAGELISQKLGKPFHYELHEGRKGDRIYDVHNTAKFHHDYPQWEMQYSLQDIINDLCGE